MIDTASRKLVNKDLTARNKSALGQSVKLGRAMALLTPDVTTTERTMAIGAICHQSPFGTTIQAVSKTAHDAMRLLLPLDAEGGYSWPRSQDAQVEDVAAERVFSLVEGAGLSIRFL